MPNIVGQGDENSKEGSIKVRSKSYYPVIKTDK